MKAFKCILIAIIAVVLLSTGAVLAEDTEEMTLTTYYPAPYGDYDEITTDTIAANRIAVGDVGMPINDGVINLQPINDDPATGGSIPAGMKGSIYFSGKSNELKIHNGIAWQSLGTESQAYDLKDVEVFTHNQETGVVLLVDITHSAGGVLLGGSVSGNRPKSVTITVDEGTTNAQTLTFSPPVCETQRPSGGGDDYKDAAFPAPIKFTQSLKITYHATQSGDHVGGIAYVIRN
jgi:hypothetical protein